MKQKLQDLKLLLKNDKRIWAGLLALIVIIVLFSFVDGNKRGKFNTPNMIKTQQQAASSPSTGATEAYGDLVVSLRNDLTQLRTQKDQDNRIIEKVQQKQQEDSKRYEGIFESIVEKIDEMGRSLDRLDKTTKDLKRRGTNQMSPEDGPQQDTVESFGFSEATVPPPPPAPPGILKTKLISPGDSVKLKLLTGVNAPVDGTPYPVVFQVMSPVVGPDGSSLEVGEARIIAAAQGSETDSRALFRLSVLALRHADGSRSAVKVDGWVVGEDGIRGLQGKLIDKLGRLILATAGISFTAALGDSLLDQAEIAEANSTDNSSDSINITTQNYDSAAASALTDASNRLGQILLDRYEKLVPVVEILSGREVVAVFSTPVEIELCEECGTDESYLTSALD